MGAFNAEMLILARDLDGMTQAQLAERMWLSQAEISRIASGSRVPPEDQIEKFAKCLRCRIDLFYISDSVKNFGSACVYHRKRQSTPQSVLRKLLALVNKGSIHIKRLLLA